MTKSMEDLHGEVMVDSMASNTVDTSAVKRFLVRFLASFILFCYFTQPLPEIANFGKKYFILGKFYTVEGGIK